jgi:hypothetical protein
MPLGNNEIGRQRFVRNDALLLAQDVEVSHHPPTQHRSQAAPTLIACSRDTT